MSQIRYWEGLITDELFRVYVEFADQYKDMDAASDVRKRNILAQHLREVVDVLEQKVCILIWRVCLALADQCPGRPNRFPLRLAELQGQAGRGERRAA